jgi:hypothetical protein
MMRRNTPVMLFPPAPVSTYTQIPCCQFAAILPPKESGRRKHCEWLVNDVLSASL